MKPGISVIIPTYNEEISLPLLLNDLSKQSNKEFEVIVCDGNSKDKTIDLAKEFEKHLKLTVKLSPKKGVAAQRNHGAMHAKGNHLVFLDADMRVRYDFIQKLYNSIHTHKRLLYIPTHIPDSSKTEDELLYNIQSFFIEISHHTKKPFTYGPAVMFLRTFYEHLGGYDEDIFAEDQEIIQRAREIGVIA